MPNGFSHKGDHVEGGVKTNLHRCLKIRPRCLPLAPHGQRHAVKNGIILVYHARNTSLLLYDSTCVFERRWGVDEFPFLELARHPYNCKIQDFLLFLPRLGVGVKIYEAAGQRW